MSRLIFTTHTPNFTLAVALPLLIRGTVTQTNSDPFQDLLMKFLLVIWSTCITNAMFDLHEHLKKSCATLLHSSRLAIKPWNINLILDQNHWPESQLAKHGKRDNIVIRKKNVESGVGQSVMGNKMFCLWCLMSCNLVVLLCFYFHLLID